MKNLTYILIAILMVACSTPSVDTSRPDEVPEWVRWGTYEHYAWEQGRIHFNEDSTIMMIVPECAEYSETSTSLIDTNVVIQTR